MTRLDRYVLRELFVPFLIGLISVVFMFAANQLIFIYKTLTAANLPIAAVAQSIIYKTPSWLQLSLPVAVSLGSSLGFSRLQRESEIVAMRGAGISVFRVIRPAIILGLAVAAANFFVTEKIMPRAERKYNDLAAKLLISGAIPSFKENVSIKLGQYVAYIGSIVQEPDDAVSVRDVFLMKRLSTLQYEIISAKSGKYQRGIWTMQEAIGWVFQGENVTSFRPIGVMTINQKITVPDLLGNQAPEERSLAQLQQAILDGKKSGISTTDLEVQLQQRFSVPAACIVFAIIGPIFAVQFAKSGAFVGVLLSMVVVMLYYNLHVISGQVLGKQGVAPPWIAAWAPVLIFLFGGLLMARRLE
jgi:lipopolysaccharide export system permease protein